MNFTNQRALKIVLLRSWTLHYFLNSYQCLLPKCIHCRFHWVLKITLLVARKSEPMATTDISDYTISTVYGRNFILSLSNCEFSNMLKCGRDYRKRQYHDSWKIRCWWVWFHIIIGNIPVIKRTPHFSCHFFWIKVRIIHEYIW